MSNPSNSEPNTRSFWQTLECASGTATDRRNQFWFVGWCLSWAIAFTLGNWFLRTQPNVAPLAAWTVALVPTALGAIAVLSYMKFLRMADELLQKIQLEGLAIGFGVGVIFTVGYQIFEKAGAPHLELDDGGLVLMFGWMLGQIISTWRYR